MFLTKESLVPDLKVSKLSLELYMGSSYFGHHSSLLKKNGTIVFNFYSFEFFKGSPYDLEYLKKYLSH